MERVSYEQSESYEYVSRGCVCIKAENLLVRRQSPFARPGSPGGHGAVCPATPCPGVHRRPSCWCCGCCGCSCYLATCLIQQYP